ncbi:MAG: guanylate kinase [Acidobacteriota bacterium]
MTGNLFIVSAPSGAGKTTLVGAVVEADERVKESVSFTSRAARAGEQNGAHYYFIPRDEFEAMIGRGDFLEWAEVHDNLYGTSRRLVEELRAAGHDVVLTIDVQGAEQARILFPDAVGVFVLPPSRETLLERLETRGANAADDLQIRLKNAQYELAQYKHFDYVIINDDLKRATGELAAIIAAERCRLKRCGKIAEEIIQTFSKS